MRVWEGAGFLVVRLYLSKEGFLCSEVTEINDGAFDGCKNLASLELPSTLAYMGGKAFANCSHWTGKKTQRETCGNIESLHIFLG